MNLTPQETEALVIGLQMRMAIIETGEPYLRICDIKQGHKGKIKALSTDQMRLIIFMEDLIVKLCK